MSTLYKTSVKMSYINKDSKEKLYTMTGNRCLRALMRFVITEVALNQEVEFSLMQRTTVYRNLTCNISSKEAAKNN